FEKGEFACGDGCGYDDISLDLVDKLQMLRNLVGKPIHITSGCRCEAYNRYIGGVDNSPHLYGLAADIQVDDMPPLTLAVIARWVNYIRIGIYPKHIHIDVKPPNPSKYWLVKNNKYIYSGKEKDLNKFLKKNL
ncbi:MAG: D-Ala-D-Ala carboxypeptidase family metallohydrolase, partial [Methanocellales archaeon]|nr:D-Ala-D-Ala carboxypeptidase family metallohydrolase [Methanocellales archaeon]